MNRGSRQDLPTIDTADFRRVLGRFATGVTVITTILKGEPAGFAANSFTSVSLDPPLVGFCAGKTSETWPVIRESGVFAVNFLAAGQSEMGRNFAAKDVDRYQGVTWRPAPATGSPLLDGAIGWIDCRIEAIHDAGDHEIVIGAVLELGAGEDGPPLLFFAGSYGTVAV